MNRVSIFLACFAALAGAIYLFLGIETEGKSIEEIDAMLPPGRGPDQKTPD